MKPLVKKTAALLCAAVFMLAPISSFAHGMHLRLEEPGILKVEYDGGGFSPRTEIILYDQDENELKKGLVNEIGKFHFDPDLLVHKAVANDGMGHKAVYREGAFERNIPKLPVVIGVFAIVGVVFILYRPKPKS